MAAERKTKGFDHPAFIKDFLKAFEEMPHRGAGTSFEPRAARILTELARRRLTGNVEGQPFAIDLSSGAWNVALHGTLLLGSLLLLWVSGLVVKTAWSAGRCPVDFGPLGVLPWPVVAACLAACLALLASRFFAGWTGWSLLSFLVPNADSSNVIVSTLPPAETELLRMMPEAAWRQRFENSGAERLVIFAAHYDSARCLSLAPRDRTPKFLRAAVKNGIGTVPTIAHVAFIVFFAFMTFLSWTGRAQAVLASPWATVVILVLVAILVAAAAAEAFLSLRSANLPFCPGFNDNLSAVAAVFDLFAEAMPRAGAGLSDRMAGPDRKRPLVKPAKTALMAVFPGSEENGLRGSIEFGRRILRPARECFGVERVLLVNLDSVSGGQLLAANAEHTFVGLVRKGDRRFLEAARRILETSRSVDGKAYAIEVQSRPLEACTDLTGFARGFRGKLRAFSISSKYKNQEPRDYHLPSDGPETLLDPDEKENVGTIVAVASALRELLEAAGKGELDG